MSQNASTWDRQRKTWAELNGLHATLIDLGRVSLIREAPVDGLADPPSLERLLPYLGLNDEALGEYPPDLHAHCGAGLRIWQYPIQFAKYLVQLSRLQVRSYLEIGIRHGGSFVATAEILDRFHPLDFAVGVDIIPCPSMEAYQGLNAKARFWCLNTRGPDFAARLDRLGPVDLVFIDSHHEEDQCRDEFELLAGRAELIAFHDVANAGCPGVRQVWQEVRRSPDFHCLEYADQYPGLGPFMGIGLAIKTERWRRATAAAATAPAPVGGR